MTDQPEEPSDTKQPARPAQKWLRAALIGVGCVIVIVLLATGLILSRRRQRTMLAGILGIPALPESVSAVQYRAWGWGDVYQTWIINIEPQDFVVLLDGHTFSQKYSGEMSHDISVTDIGKAFRVIHVFTAWSSSDLYGGTIIVAPDDERQRVMICRHSEKNKGNDT